MGEWEQQKIPKLVGQGKDSLISGAKKGGKQAKQVMQKQSLTTSHSRQMPSQSLSKGYLPKTPLPSDFYSWRLLYKARNIPLVILCQLSSLGHLPTSYAPPAYSLLGQREKQSRSWLCVSIAQQHLKHGCIINTVLITYPKLCTITGCYEEN